MLRLLERLEEGLIAFLLTVMTLITFTQVVARYVFNYSFVWALELNTFLFAWLIFLGVAYGVRGRRAYRRRRARQDALSGQGTYRRRSLRRCCAWSTR